MMNDQQEQENKTIDAQSVSDAKKRLKKKADIFVFGIFLPVVIILFIIYIFVAPKTFDLGEGYILSPSDDGFVIRNTAGRIITGPGDIRVWGRNPFLYGYCNGKGFVINMETHKLTEYDEESSEFKDFLEKRKLDPDLPVTYDQLYADKDVSKKNIRKRLRYEMSRPPEKIDFLNNLIPKL